MSDGHGRYVGGKPTTASSNQMVRDIYNSLKHLQLREGNKPSVESLLQSQSSFEQQLALGAGNINALSQGIPGERRSFPRASKAVALEESQNARPFVWPSSNLTSNGRHQNFKSNSVTDLHQLGLTLHQKFAFLVGAGYDEDLIIDTLQNYPDESLETLREILNMRTSARPIQQQQRLYSMIPQPNSRPQSSNSFNPAIRLPASNPSVYQPSVAASNYSSSSQSSNASYQSIPTSQYMKQRPLDNSMYTTRMNESMRLNEQRQYSVSAAPENAAKYIPYQHNSYGDRQYSIQNSADSYSYEGKQPIAVDGWKQQLSSDQQQQNAARQQVIDAVTIRSKPENRKISQTKRYSKELSNYEKRNSMEVVPNKPPPPYPGYQAYTRVTSHDSSSAEVVQPNHAPITVIFDEKNDQVNVIGGIPDGYERMGSSSTPSSGQSSPRSTPKDPPPYNFPSSHHSTISKPVTQQVTSFYSGNPDGQTTQQYFQVHIPKNNIPYPISSTEQQFKPINDTHQERPIKRDRGSPPPYPGSRIVNQGSVNSDDLDSGYSCVMHDSSGSSKKTSTTTEPGSVNVSDSSASTSPTPDDVERSYSPLPTVSNTYKTMVIHTEKKENEKPIKESPRKEPISCRLKNYTPQAYKFYMEQHVENILKLQEQRKRRRRQLEVEMERARLPQKDQEEMIKLLAQKESNHMRLRRAKMDKSMFTKVKAVGVGAFGEVSLVRKNGTDAYYAMKTLRKSEVLRRNQVAHVKAERDILAEADSEWVVKLYYSFQDDQNLYFVMQYVPGGDLMALLIKFGLFSEQLAKFYIAELVLAIESVHKLGFIHRDIKPDNVLIDRNGHIKLTDFGLCTGFRWTHDSKYYLPESEQTGHARQYSMEPEGGWESLLNDTDCNCTSHRLKYDLCKPLERRRMRRHMRCQAHSLVGTPNYIAPEVLLRIPYGQQCDWWSVGVILYEMVVGQPPFVARSPAETQWKVIHWQDTLHIPPSRPLPPDTRDIILRLCTSPDERIGRDGADEIKMHQYFSDIDFDTIHTEQAPYVPQIKSRTDTSNFDPVPENMSTDFDDDNKKKNNNSDLKKGPEYAFYEFTFRHFFDDGGHANPFYEKGEKVKNEPRPRALNHHPSKRSAPAAANKSMTVPNKIPVPNVSTPEEKQPVYV